jgi:hypothetical protein
LLVIGATSILKLTHRPMMPTVFLRSPREAIAGLA